MRECSKCGSDHKIPGAYVNCGGQNYYICHLCMCCLNRLPGKALQFLRDDECKMIDNGISRNIILARMKRMGMPKVDN